MPFGTCKVYEPSRSVTTGRTFALDLDWPSAVHATWRCATGVTPSAINALPVINGMLEVYVIVMLDVTNIAFSASLIPRILRQKNSASANPRIG